LLRFADVSVGCDALIDVDNFGTLPKQRDEHVSASLDILSKSCCVEREEIVRVIVE